MRLSHLVIRAFQQSSVLFQMLASIEHKPSQQATFLPIFSEEISHLGTESGSVAQHFVRVTLQMFLLLSSARDLASCFCRNCLTAFIVRKINRGFIASSSQAFETDKTDKDAARSAVDALDREFSAQAIEIVVNLFKFGDFEIVVAFANAGIVPALLNIVKYETAPSNLTSSSLFVLSKAVCTQSAVLTMHQDSDFLFRIPHFLSRDHEYSSDTLNALVLLRHIIAAPDILEYLIANSKCSDLLNSVLEIFQCDFADTKLQALGVLSVFAANDRIKVMQSNTTFLASILSIVEHPPSPVHLKLSLVSLVNICSNCPQNLKSVAFAPGLIQHLCEHYSVSSDDPAVAHNKPSYFVFKLGIEHLVVLSAF
jgi:hypothetical protein